MARSASYSAAGFDAVFEACGLTVLRSPLQAPPANVICERLIRTLRRELHDHLLILNQAHLRAVLGEYATHYNARARTSASPNASPTTSPTRGLST